MGKDTFERHRSLFTASFDPQLKKRFIKRFVWGVFLYGSETCMDSQESRHEKNRRFGDVDMEENGGKWRTSSGLTGSQVTKSYLELEKPAS